MLPHPLTKSEIQNYYQNEPKSNDIYWRYNLSEIKNEAYVINFDEYRPTETNFIGSYVNGDNVTYFDSFGVIHILKEIKKIHRQQKYHYKYFQNTSIQFNNIRYFCVGFINFMLKGTSLSYYTNLFSPNEYKKNVKVILKYF